MYRSSLPYKAEGIASATFPNSATTFAAVTAVPATSCAAGKLASVVNKVSKPSNDPSPYSSEYL